VLADLAESDNVLVGTYSARGSLSEFYEEVGLIVQRVIKVDGRVDW
jgi:hypothetical protein